MKIIIFFQTIAILYLLFRLHRLEHILKKTVDIIEKISIVINQHADLFGVIKEQVASIKTLFTKK